MMESPSTSPLSPSPLHTLSSRRRRSRGSSPSTFSTTASPDHDFAFWSDTTTFLHPPPTLHSADELFSDGFLLPLHSLSLQSEPDPGPESEPGPTPDPEQEPGPGPVLEEKEETQNPASIMASTSSSTSSILSTSKRWKEIIFKRGGIGGESKGEDTKKATTKKKTAKGENVVKRREREVMIKSSSSSQNELNINLWPFSRSRSAGNNASRSKPVQSNRKVSSAPCSRSNSSGERRERGVGPVGVGTVNRRGPVWPSSPGRTGVHVGRASPVWPGPRRRKEKGAGKVLNLNVPMCMGYRESLSCRNDENGAAGEGSGLSGGRGGGGVNGHFLGLRGLFGKKSVVTV